MSIRPMTRDDLSWVVEIELRSQPSAWSRQQFLRELELPYSRLTVAESEGTGVGYLSAWDVAGELEIQNVVTSPDFIRRGVASRLIEELLEYARSRGAERLLLEVRSGNEAAIELYRRYGFHESGRRRKYYADGEDALLMTLELNRERAG